MRVSGFFIGSVFLLFMHLSGHAQRILSEAKCTYSIQIKGKEEDKGLMAAFEGATQTVWLKGLRARVDFSSKLRSQSIFFNQKDSIVVMTRETGEEKFIFTISPSKWKLIQSDSSWRMIVLTDSTQENRNGFSCQPAKLESKAGDETMICFTKDIQPMVFGFDRIWTLCKGVPVQYTISMEGMEMLYTLESIEYITIVSGKFDIPVNGYKEIEVK